MLLVAPFPLNGASETFSKRGQESLIRKSAEAVEIAPLDAVEITVEPWTWPFAQARREDMDRHFAARQRERPTLWNGRVMPLPPRAPELNGQENIWQFMRQNWLSNRIFKSFDDIVDHCCYAWNTLIDRPWKIMSIARRDWAWVTQCEDWYNPDLPPIPVFFEQLMRDELARSLQR